MSRPREPFDWAAFWKTFYYQPVPVWIVSALLLRPAARATPWLLRATCAGPARAGLTNYVFILYALSLPAAAAAFVYLLLGRRRMIKTQRLMADCCLALVLLISAANAASLARQIRTNWTTFRPGLHSLHDACWK